MSVMDGAACVCNRTRNGSHDFVARHVVPSSSRTSHQSLEGDPTHDAESRATFEYNVESACFA